ncbi:MAG: S24 family peptidase [Planctomycetes bacterium]|nr:S24 family peptidase [Planctomycetota bacterium]
MVAAKCANGDHLLRRIWSDGDSWTFQSINAVRPINSVVAAKIDSGIRKVVGVLYEEHRTPGSSTGAATIEWQPRADFRVGWISKLACVRVEGRSLDPIARARQHVLIDKQPTTDHLKVNNGDLAVVDTNVDSIGRVIKRVYRSEGHCILVSPNPVDPHAPEILDEAQLVEAKFWIVRGVLFESND